MPWLFMFIRMGDRHQKAASSCHPLTEAEPHDPAGLGPEAEPASLVLSSMP